MAIFFNSRDGSYRDFNPSSAHAFTLDGELWQSAEHYVQAQRFSCPKAKAKIRTSQYAFTAKAIARDRPDLLRDDWEAIRDDVMEKALRCKFSTHPGLGKKLCATGDHEIIEASPLNPYWGAGADGRGKNKLGRLLMKIRQELAASLQSHSAGEKPENRIG